MNCPNCNAEILQNESYCSNCGNPLNAQSTPAFHNQVQPQPVYVSSKPNYGVIPPEIRKWNWGAFTLNIFWGIGNHAYLTLLCLVPFLNIVWIFVCGANGNKWAWESGEFKSVEEFLAVQRTWNRAGIAIFILQVAFLILYLLLAMLFLALFFNYTKLL